ncbi:MAG: hypothetical protein Q7V01_08710 [Vicinamibacterales bacterium]|nr:hypothetical protein [Vicinamibacterales bacterium]
MMFRYRLVSVLLVVLAVAADAPAQSLSPELAILTPLVGRTWVGRMTSPDGQHTPAHVRRRADV